MLKIKIYENPPRIKGTKLLWMSLDTGIISGAKSRAGGYLAINHIVRMRGYKVPVTVSENRIVCIGNEHDYRYRDIENHNNSITGKSWSRPDYEKYPFLRKQK